MVEFALVVPLLLLLLLAIVGYGLALYRTLTVTSSVRSAVRLGIIGATPCQMYGDILYLMPGTQPTVNYTYTTADGTITTCSIAYGGPDGCTESVLSDAYSQGGYLNVQIVDPVTSPVYLPGLGTSYTITESSDMMQEQAGTVTAPGPTGWSPPTSPSWCSY